MKSRNFARKALKVSLLAIPVVLTACKEPPPPPAPPPPPPPPPPPARVDVQEVLASMEGVDARVQAAGGLRVLEEEEPMVRAAIRFADALARGDDLELEGMLSADAQTILDDLRFGGQWYDAVENIEQVRILYLTPDAREEGIEVRPTGTMDQALGDAMSGMDPAMMEAMGEMMAVMSAYNGDEEAMNSEMADAVRVILEDDQDLTRRVAEAMELEGEPTVDAIVEELSSESDDADSFDPEEFTPERAAPILELFAAIQASDEVPDRAKNFASALHTMVSTASSMDEERLRQTDASMDRFGDTKMGALALAIQTPGEAYVLGWTALSTAGGGWAFGGAPVSAPTVARASELDGQVNPSSFTIDFSALGQSDEISRASLPQPPEPEPEAEEEDEPSETTRRTPRGPITIPGGG